MSIVVTDEADRVRYEHVVPTDPSALVRQVAGLVDDARARLGEDIAAVGVAIPGHVDPADGSVRMAVNLGITHLPLADAARGGARDPRVRRARRPRGGGLAERAARLTGRHGCLRASRSSRSGPGSRPASCSTGRCSAGTTASPARWATSSSTRMGPTARAGCGAASRRSSPGPAIGRQADEAVAAGRSTVLTRRRDRRGRLPRRGGRRRGGGRDHRSGGRPPGPLDRGRSSLTLGVRRVVIGGGVAAAGPRCSIRSDPASPANARPRRSSTPRLGEANVELLSPTEAPGARGAALLARHRVRLPEREGVGER